MTQVRDFRRLGDQDLLVAARAGQAEAFSGLVDRYHAPLLRFLIRLTGDRELAEDLVQESFVAAYQHLNQLADDRSFAAWLYQIARNRQLSVRRRYRIVRLVSLDWLIERGHTRYFCQPCDQEQQAQQDQVQRALDTLSPTLREALLLHHLCGFSGSEIAQMLSISPAAAQKRIGRADEEFRRLFDQHAGAHL